MILLLALIFTGPKKLPDLGAGLATLVRARRPTAPDAQRWSWSDGLLAISASVAVAAVIANALLLRR